MGSNDKVRPGDIVMFNLPQTNATYFGQAVLYFQRMITISNNRKTHAAMVVEVGDNTPKMGETQLRVIDVEFGRKVSTYFVPLEYGDVDIYRPFNTELFCTFPNGTATTAKSEQISRRAAEIAMSYLGASYGVTECLQALTTHKNGQEYQVNGEYIAWLNTINNKSTFMCVSFVLICYQKACLEILGGLPQPFQINARVAPRYLAHHIESSGHFRSLPPNAIKDILETAAPIYRRSHTHGYLSWFWSKLNSTGYQQLIASSPYEESIDGSSRAVSEDGNDDGSGAGMSNPPTVQ